ncbi:MAG: hypothetical protein QP772_08140, partial [Actinomycetaceae bacterium UMB1218B]|nr:hypothetical protein [Actinomycetaceae bacterium UMB1218B]
MGKKAEGADVTMVAQLHHESVLTGTIIPFTIKGKGQYVQRWTYPGWKENLMISRSVVIASSVGLHARPAAVLA